MREIISEGRRISRGVVMGVICDEDSCGGMSRGEDSSAWIVSRSFPEHWSLGLLTAVIVANVDLSCLICAK